MSNRDRRDGQNMSNGVRSAPGGGRLGAARARAGGRHAGAIVLTMLLAGLLAGCGPRTYRGMLVEDNAISQAMVAVQQAEQRTFADHAYDAARHQRYAAAIEAILKDGDQLDHAMRGWRRGQPEPAVVVQAVGRLRQMLTEVGTLEVPASHLLATLEHALGLLTVGRAEG